jgi:hypothetical protein
MLHEQAQRHDRRLDRLDGEAQHPVSAPAPVGAGCWMGWALRGTLSTVCYAEGAQLRSSVYALPSAPISPPPLPSILIPLPSRVRSPSPLPADLLGVPPLSVVRSVLLGYCGTIRSSWGSYPEGTGTHHGVPRSTARGGRNMGVNNLDGTLPAELGKLTDLERLCAALRRCCRAADRRDRSAPLRSRACGGAQRL